MSEKDVKKKNEAKKSETKKSEVKKKDEVEKLNVNERWIRVLSEVPEKLPMVEGYGYKYTPLPNILNSLREILKRYGFGLSQSWDFNSDLELVEIDTIIYYEDGIFLTTDCALPIVDVSKSNIVQKIGATITYGRRYIVSALFGLATEEDTDANVSNADGVSKDISGDDYHKWKKDKEKSGKSERPPELKKKLSEIWKKIVEAKELGILDEEIVNNQIEALKKISTISGAIAYEKAVLRLIEKEHQKKAESMKEAEKENQNVESEPQVDVEDLEGELPI